MGGVPSSYGSDEWNIGNSMEELIGMDMAVHDSVWATLPDGTAYPITVGSLALGAPGTVNQTFGFGNGEPAINLTLLGGYLEHFAPSNKVLSSNSYGLHIGSVSPPLSPSLQMGGFDQNRALGNVSAQQGEPQDSGAIDLLDIALNVVSGSSPFNFSGTSLGGLLASGNSSMGQTLPVAINSLSPYLSLPESTCDAIAANLPVTYNSKYGLYLWNTTAPQYQKIVTSPSVLAFTFRSSDNSNLTINVPFSLLNLNLTAPITTDNTPYFPCQPTTWTNFQLGRAFLQAAFIGVNFDAYGGKAAWFLAQAPGPNTPSQSVVLAMGDTDITITGSSDVWEDTWKGYWTPLTQADVSPTTTASGANQTQSPTTSPTSSGTGINKNASSGLSVGAKAGIGIAAAAAVIAALIGAFLLFRRHRKNAEGKAHVPDYSTVPTGPGGPYYEPAKPPMQQYAQQQVGEMGAPSPSQTPSTYHASSSNGYPSSHGYPQSPPVEMNSEPVRHELG